MVNALGAAGLGLNRPPSWRQRTMSGSARRNIRLNPLEGRSGRFCGFRRSPSHEQGRRVTHRVPAARLVCDEKPETAPWRRPAGGEPPAGFHVGQTGRRRVRTDPRFTLRLRVVRRSRSFAGRLGRDGLRRRGRSSGRGQDSELTTKAGVRRLQGRTRT